MNLYLQREPSNEECTFGKLYIEDEYFCETLEDPVREDKIYGATAIPEGRYRVRITYSPKFRKQLPLLADVPNFSGVRIHPGNYARDSDGCILPGIGRGPNMVSNSRAAFRKLIVQITRAIDANQQVWITIRGSQTSHTRCEPIQQTAGS